MRIKEKSEKEEIPFSITHVLTQYVVELVQIVLSREDGSVGQHLSQDATHRPYINGHGVALKDKEIMSNYASSSYLKC